MSRLQKVVTGLKDWGITWGLKFNSSKTEVVIFTKSNLKVENNPKRLVVGGQKVDFSPSAKYLGQQA